MGASRRIRSRLGVLSLAVAYLLLQFGAVWHLAEQGHARCAAHGEWIEVVQRPSTVERAPDAGPIVDFAAPVQAHDHCMVVKASRIRAVVQELAPLVPLHEPLVAGVPANADDPLDIGFDRYLLAPKQSPPC